MFARLKNIKYSLKTRLLFWVWLSSSLATFVFTMTQLSYEFKFEKDSALQQVSFIKKNYLPLIINSAWDYDIVFLNLQVQSISRLNYVCYVKLNGIEGVNFLDKCNSANDKDVKISKLQLSKNGKSLGNLEVGIDINSIEKTYLKKAINIFFFQALKTFIVCYLLLIVFSRVIMKHLLRITEYVRDLNIEDNSALLLSRDNNISDEVTTLVNSINIMKEKLQVSQIELKSFNAKLEDKVKERTSELEVARARAIESSKLAALGEMAGGVAHEINNPLAIIAGSVVVLEKAKKKGFVDDEYFFKITTRIKETVKRISDIVNGLMSVSRGGNDTEKSKVFLNKIFENVFGLCREKFRASGIRLDMNSLQLTDEAFVWGNHVLLSQVFINLINNAYDAVKELASSDQWVAIEGRETEDSFIIKVIDGGAGISEDIRDKIFNPFFTSKEIGKGTGLGLSISLGIVKDFGGNIYYDKESGHTCFVVEFKKSS